eukprot:TRINITY_DN36104_c0_g1_i1.p1 TRINITY_DN36104_c0_g1~~TRINITY_DN36104_c0_g1_i1.p1  ORF type:complete len:744 (+),score=161.80 TRINITY_DN36104_c0_g1_i1:90-2321(+)
MGAALPAALLGDGRLLSDSTSQRSGGGSSGSSCGCHSHGRPRSESRRFAGPCAEDRHWACRRRLPRKWRIWLSAACSLCVGQGAAGAGQEVGDKHLPPGAQPAAALRDVIMMSTTGMPLLDCKNDPAWSAFLQLMLAAATKSQQGGFVLDEQLVVVAQALASTFEEESAAGGAGLAGGVEKFYQDICKEAASSFCLYGAVNAFFVVAADMHRQSASEEMVASGGGAAAAAAASLRSQAQSYLNTASRILGLQKCLDFMESSSWPVKSHDLLANVNRSAQTMFALAVAGGSTVPTAYVPIAGSSLDGWPAQRLASALARTVDCPSGKVGILAVGTHPTLTLEAVTMIRQFGFSAGDKQAELLRTLGVVYKCSVFPAMCGSGAASSMPDPIAELIGPFEAPPPYEMYTMSRLREVLEQVGREIMSGVHTPPDAGVRVPGMLVCTSPFVVCALLQQATKLPLLGYLGLPMIWKRPTDHFDRPEARAEFWNLLKALGQEKRVVLVTNNPLLSEQIAFQSGMLLPTIRVHALFTQAVYMPAQQDKALLVSRTKFYWVTMGCALKHFTPVDYPVKFVVLNSDSKMPFKELASHRAAVLVPWEHALMAFFEFYSMGVPLLLPDTPWAYRLLFDDEGNLGSTTSQYYDVAPECDLQSGCLKKERPHPSPPFAFASLESRRYWYQYSSLVQWPFVYRFASLPHLLELLLTADLAHTSASMRSFNDRTLVQSIAFWREATTKLVSSGPEGCTR